MEENEGLIFISGAGGGGGGSSKPQQQPVVQQPAPAPRTPTEDPESLRSRSEATFVAVISEGEIQCFEDGVDPLSRIYLDDVPIKNNDGSLNFSITSFFTGSAASSAGKGSFVNAIATSIPSLNRTSSTGNVNSIVIDYRTGTQNQAAMPGFDDIKIEQGVNVKVTRATGAIFRTTTNEILSSIRVRMGIGALFSLDVNSGDVKGGTVQFAIRIRPNGGSNFIDDVQTIQGKSRGPVDFEYEYAVQGTGPWIVSVERLSADPATTSVSNDLFFKAIIGVYNQSFRYPNTAILGLKLGAENFGSIPQIAGDLLGMKIKVPINYNPTLRTYSGIWNGTFQTVWSNNPAWVFYDLLTNSRYGAGKFISESQVDKYSLYPIAQYCDELVPNGKGGMEPRLTFNGYITDSGEAYEVLNAMAAVFRGMLYFSEGTIVAIQDRPKSITKIFSPSNVIQELDSNGSISEPCFSYEGTGRKARKTVALVSWNDPEDRYKAKIEYVEDREGIDRYGYQTIDIRAFGTTSQGQAQRIGKWTLLTNQLETEVVTFKTASQGLFVFPGEIIGIADPAKGGKRYGGRIEAATISRLTIDNSFTIVSGATYQASVMLPDGSIESRNLVNGPGSAKELLLSSGLTTVPVVGAPWALQENNGSVRTFRTISVSENEGIVTILASLYDESKFALTDNGTNIGAVRTSVAGPAVAPLVKGGSIVLEVT